MIKFLLFLIFILLLSIIVSNKKPIDKELFVSSCNQLGRTIGKNLGTNCISDCKIQSDCKLNECPDNMERIDKGPCVKKCSNLQYRDKITGKCKFKPCDISGKERDSQGNCYWTTCSDIRKERDEITGKCEWKSCDNKFRKRDEKTGVCKKIPCPGPNPTEQTRNKNGDCEYKPCSYPNIQERLDGICNWKQCDDIRKERDNLGNCNYKQCENSNQHRNENGNCDWKPCPDYTRKLRDENGNCIWKKCEKSGMILDEINGDCNWPKCNKLGMIQDDNNGKCSWPKCPGSNQKRIDGNCVDIIDCELDETIYSNCLENNNRSSGQRVKISPQNGGIECTKPKGRINGETVYNFQEGIDCGSCGSNQKRIQGTCIDIVDCELNDTIYSDCQKNNTRSSGQSVKVRPQNGGIECSRPSGNINGQNVYNFKENLPCEPCDYGKIRENGICKQDWRPRGPCSLNGQFEYKGCFQTPRGVWNWGGGDLSQKSDGNMEYRLGVNKYDGQSENDMLKKCYNMANRNYHKQDKFLIGLQNQNQCFYMNYDKNNFNQNFTKFKGQPRECRNFPDGYGNCQDRKQGGGHLETQIYIAQNR